MNVTTLKGEAQDIGGSIKEGVGKAANDPGLVGEGKADQLTGHVNQAAGAAKDALGPLVDKAKGFAKARPFAFAALAGVVGLALVNTLRGKR